MKKELRHLLTTELPPTIPDSIYPFTVTNVKKESDEVLRITLAVKPNKESDEIHNVLLIIRIRETSIRFCGFFAASLGVNFESILFNENCIKGLTGKARFSCNKYTNDFGENTHRTVAQYFYPKSNA